MSTRKVVPSWKCNGCNKWTPHGRYSCQHCGTAQPQYPELAQRALDGSIPPPDEQPTADRGSRGAPGDLASYLTDAGYDKLVPDVSVDWPSDKLVHDV